MVSFYAYDITECVNNSICILVQLQFDGETKIVLLCICTIYFCSPQIGVFIILKLQNAG